MHACADARRCLLLHRRRIYLPRLSGAFCAAIFQSVAVGAVKLCELSEGYIESAQVLRAKLKTLRADLRHAKTPQERAALRSRIAALAEILTQCNELSELTAHYYERGFYRNERYTL